MDPSRPGDRFGPLSFGFGLFLAYQIGIVDHLFSAAPIWIPQ